mgnify:FL=1
MPAHLDGVDGEGGTGLVEKLRDFCFTARGPGTAPEIVSVDPQDSTHCFLANGAGPIRIDSVVLAGGAEKKIRITKLIPALLSYAKFTQRRAPFPFVGNDMNQFEHCYQRTLHEVIDGPVRWFGARKCALAS